MIMKEKTSTRKKRFYNKTIDKSIGDNLQIKGNVKIHNRNSKDVTSARNQERNRIVEKGTKIIVAILIVSFFYSLGFLFKYSQTTQFESIILSLIFSSSFTCLVGFLIGKYLIQQSNSKLKKEFNT
jgi:hypothetical protein